MEILPEGSLVARGVYWNQVRGATRWFSPPPTNQRQERIFRVRYVLEPDVIVEEPSATVTLPNRRDKARILALGPRRVTLAAEDTINSELAHRARIDYEEDNNIVEDVGDEEEEDSDGMDTDAESSGEEEEY